MNELVIMYCYARSGGTLLNKSLGSVPNLLIVSEINPFGGGFGKGRDPRVGTISGQMKEWYGIELKAKDYKSQILELYKYCYDNNLKLVLRDWIYLSYNVSSYYNNRPSYKFDTYEMFRNEIPIRSFAFVRNCVDVWISMGRKRVDDFLLPYSAYVNELINLKIPYYRYEDFVDNPVSTMKRLCDMYGWIYPEKFLDEFNTNPALGDTTVNDKSRLSKDVIRRMNRKAITPLDILRFNVNKTYYEECNKPFMYETNYFNESNTAIDYILNLSKRLVEY